MHKRGPKPPPFLWEKGDPANFKIPKILTEFSFGIGRVNTEKIPKGSYQNTESVCNSRHSPLAISMNARVNLTLWTGTYWYLKHTKYLIKYDLLNLVTLQKRH